MCDESLYEVKSFLSKNLFKRKGYNHFVDTDGLKTLLKSSPYLREKIGDECGVVEINNNEIHQIMLELGFTTNKKCLFFGQNVNACYNIREGSPGARWLYSYAKRVPWFHGYGEVASFRESYGTGRRRTGTIIDFKFGKSELYYVLESDGKHYTVDSGSVEYKVEKYLKPL